MLPNMFVSFLPLSCYFETTPEFEEIVQRVIQESFPQEGCNLLCFVPSTVNSDISKVMKRIEDFCTQNRLFAVVNQVNLFYCFLFFFSAFW